jgi:hypothetical protein
MQIKRWPAFVNGEEKVGNGCIFTNAKEGPLRMWVGEEKWVIIRTKFNLNERITQPRILAGG